MADTFQELEEARATRLETLSIVEDLDQERSERRPAPEKWSAGEVLDHLLKLDALVIRELELTLSQRRRGLPLTYRGIADVDPTIPWVLRPVLPFFEVPFAFVNAVFPQPLRRSILASRRVPLRAPRGIRPRFGRPIEALREELGKTYDVLEEQQADRIRLFAVDRSARGKTQIRRVEVTPELLAKAREGWPLSRLWVSGHLGGVANVSRRSLCRVHRRAGTLAPESQAEVRSNEARRTPQDEKGI